MGLTGWPEDTAFNAALSCYQAWLKARGGDERLEVMQTLKQARLFFEQYGESRFSPMSGSNYPTNNRAGVRQSTPDGTEFLVFPEVFREEICKGLDSRFAAKTLVDNGWIIPDSDGKYQMYPRLPGIGKKRVYHFSTKAISDDIESNIIKK